MNAVLTAPTCPYRHIGPTDVKRTRSKRRSSCQLAKFILRRNNSIKVPAAHLTVSDKPDATVAARRPQLLVVRVVPEQSPSRLLCRRGSPGRVCMASQAFRQG